MERSRAVLITLVCVLVSRISGAEVELRVTRGDIITLYCDCFVPLRSEMAWFKKCSDESHPPLLLTSSSSSSQTNPRFIFVRNSSSKSYDLVVKKVTEQDLGWYYCARQEKDPNRNTTVYHYGKLTTRIILREPNVPCADPPRTPSTPPVSDCGVCWKLLVSVCPVCVLLSSTCVCCICRNRDKVKKKNGEIETQEKQKTRRNEEVGGDDVCYASLDLPKRRQKRLKKKRVESSEFCTYSEVKHDQM